MRCDPVIRSRLDFRFHSTSSTKNMKHHQEKKQGDDATSSQEHHHNKRQKTTDKEDTTCAILTLSNDLTLLLVSFLDFAGLLALRATSRALQTASHEILRQRGLDALQGENGAFLGLRSYDGKNSWWVRFQEEQSAELATLDGVVEHALRAEALFFLNNDPDFSSQKNEHALELRRSGQTMGVNTLPDTRLRWSRCWRQSHEHEYLSILGDCDDSDDAAIDQWYEDRNKIKANMESYFGLLLSSRTIGFSAIVCDEEKTPSGGTIESYEDIYRLDNNVEIRTFKKWKELVYDGLFASSSDSSSSC